LEETAALLAGREIEDLINLPKMVAQNRWQQFISWVILLHFLSPALMILITCRMVSINHGNATWSPMSYANYGLVLCGVVQDIELGYKFGKWLSDWQND